MGDGGVSRWRENNSVDREMTGESCYRLCMCSLPDDVFLLSQVFIYLFIYL